MKCNTWRPSGPLLEDTRHTRTQPDDYCRVRPSSAPDDTTSDPHRSTTQNPPQPTTSHTPPPQLTASSIAARTVVHRSRPAEDPHRCAKQQQLQLSRWRVRRKGRTEHSSRLPHCFPTRSRRTVPWMMFVLLVAVPWLMVTVVQAAGDSTSSGLSLLLDQTAGRSVAGDRLTIDEDLGLNDDGDEEIDDDDLMLGDSAGDGIGGGSSADSGDLFGSSLSEKSLENSIAAVFNKVAYGSTTTKRSIPDVFVPSLTTVATPSLTTYRYRDREKDTLEDTMLHGNHQTKQQQQPPPPPPPSNPHHRSYELELERDHALPTSSPNAEILKSNNNPSYPNPNRHQHHDRDRHRHGGGGNINSTPSPSVHNLLKKGPTSPMFSGDMPSYSPPGRNTFTPPLPREYTNPFADKPTLRGTNSDSVVYSSGGGPGLGGGGAGGPGGGGGGGVGPIGAGGLGGGGVGGSGVQNRRPIPPPSLLPGQERIPYRAPDLVGKTPVHQQQPSSPSIGGDSATGSSDRKKALNTPAHQNNQKQHGGGGKADHDQPMTNSSSNSNEPTSSNSAVLHFPSISRILSGSNGRKEDIPEVLLRTVTARPSFQPAAQPASKHADDSDVGGGGSVTNLNANRNDGGAGDDLDLEMDEEDGSLEDDDDVDVDEDDFSMFDGVDKNPKMRPNVAAGTAGAKSTQSPLQSDSSVFSTQIVQHNGGQTTQPTTPNHNRMHQSSQSSSSAGASSTSSSASSSPSSSSSAAAAAAHSWAVAWNIHVYLSAILFTILAVYSIFKMIFYDKLTHLFNQSYFISIHLILIVICLARIFFLCYDAYNIHASFHTFVAELLLNLPATFLTVAFACLVLFLLIRSLNHKNNRYAALMRPLTVVVGSSVHVGLCITLHYVESTSSHSQAQQMYYQNQARLRNGGGHHQQQSPHHPPYAQPPRVLSLICQIIYIFVCLSLGLFYLYVYRILKRILRNKSQNYIHGYQNLSYAIHITIATALLFVLLAALQVYGAISISTTRPLISSTADIDWLQCGYQFSLRLIEIAIITLLSWVTGLRTGAAAKVLQREKGLEQHNVSGFALFPCTSSSSQEHFETDYPAICNANTNLHTYTLRTGKPIYSDDQFALNAMGMEQQQGQQSMVATAPGGTTRIMTAAGGAADFQVPNSNEFTRTYESNSARSSTHTAERGGAPHVNQSEFLNDGSSNAGGAMPDHYENPNFELRSSVITGDGLVLDNCYSEPLNQAGGGGAFDFQNFEKPTFDRGANNATEFRASKNLNALKNNNNNLDRQHYDNTERRSGNSQHSGGQQQLQHYATGRTFNNLNYQSHHNSFDRHRGLRKSGTLNNIGSSGGGGVPIGVHHNNGGSGRGGASSASSNSSNGGVGGGGRPSGVQTMSSGGRMAAHPSDLQIMQRNTATRLSQQQLAQIQQQQQHTAKKDRHRSNVERTAAAAAAAAAAPAYMLPGGELEGPDYNDRMMMAAAGRGAYDSVSMSSEGQHSGAAIGVDLDGGSVHVAGAGVRYQSDRRHHHDMTGGGHHLANNHNNHSSSGSGGESSATSGSMLVAEHGFVRFRAIDQLPGGAAAGQQQQHQQQQSFRGGGQPQVPSPSGGGGGGTIGSHRGKDQLRTSS